MNMLKNWAIKDLEELKFDMDSSRYGARYTLNGKEITYDMVINEINNKGDK